MKDKDEQDSYIQRLMELQSVQRKRSRLEMCAEQAKPKSVSIKYFVTYQTKKQLVCKSAFLSVFGITKKRCERLIFLSKNNQSPRDMRGKNISGNALGGEIMTDIHSYLESFPVKLSHYTGKEIKYLDAKLSVKKMYEMFKEKYTYHKVSYKSFWSYFKENFNLRFGRPQKDTCPTCEELNAKIKSQSLNENAKKVAVAELLIHKRRSQKFYTALSSIKKICQDDTKSVGICIDYMANLSLPQIPVQDLYYYRQLTVCNFGVHNLSTGSMKCYVYHEGEAGKGPNEVISFINHYINNDIGKEVERLYIFCDNCAGQNKNNAIIRFLMGLVENKRFKEVQILYPMRGHSFMPCDRDFGLIKRSLIKYERLYTIDQYINLISEASKIANKFSVVKVDQNYIIDYKKWWPTYYKKTCLSNASYGKNVPRANKSSFALSSYHHLTVSCSNKNEIKCREFINALVEHTFRLRNSTTGFLFPIDKAYNGKLPINEKKLEDIKNTLKFIPEEYIGFWKPISEWPSKSDENLLFI